jgi:hypothetical protein
LILRSSQASAMWICITRPDISRHTLFLRVCPPTLSSQVVWVLRRPPRFSTHREPPNANLLMPVLELRFLETQSRTSPSPPPLLERLRQTPKRPNSLTLRSCHGSLTAMQATFQDFLWLTTTNCFQHACPPATHTWTFSLSLLCSSSSSAAASQSKARKLPVSGQSYATKRSLIICRLKFRSIWCVFILE